jgi:two-component system response regulator ChvI
VEIIAQRLARMVETRRRSRSKAGFMAGNGTDGYLVNVRATVKKIRRKFMAIDSNFTAIINHAGFGYSWLKIDAT